MKKLFVSAAVAALLASAGAAQAVDSNQAQLNVQVEVQQGCTVAFNSSETINFGKVDKANFQGDTRPGAFTVKCAGAPAKVELNNGQNDQNGQRRMAQGDQYVPYDVYQGTSNKGQRWGTGNDAYKVPAAATQNDGQPQSFTVDLPKASVTPNLKNGIYKDVLTATVWYDNSGV